MERNIQASIDLIKKYNIPHQFRTTFDKRYLNEIDLQLIKDWIQDDSFVVNKCILRDKNGEPINE